MRRVWDCLQEEGREAAAWLGLDFEGILASPVEGVGQGSLSGATRGSIVETVETVRALLLSKALEHIDGQMEVSVSYSGCLY